LVIIPLGHAIGSHSPNRDPHTILEVMVYTKAVATMQYYWSQSWS